MTFTIQGTGHIKDPCAGHYRSPCVCIIESAIFRAPPLHQLEIGVAAPLAELAIMPPAPTKPQKQTNLLILTTFYNTPDVAKLAILTKNGIVRVPEGRQRTTPARFGRRLHTDEKNKRCC